MPVKPYPVITLIIFAWIIAFFSCQPKEPNAENAASVHDKEKKYDSLAAAKYGADAWGMKKYVIAFLKKGPNRELDSAKAMELQMAHLKNIGKMAEEGKLVLAGPFLDGSELRGIYIFNVETLEQARELTETDPAVQAGSLTMELKEWYGTAALMAVNDIHETLSKSGIMENE